MRTPPQLRRTGPRTVVRVAALALCLAGVRWSTSFAEDTPGPAAGGAGATTAPVDRAEIDRAVELINGQRYDLAAKALSRLLAEQPDHAPALLLRATSYRLSRDFDAAVPDFDRVLQLDPQNFEALYGRALARYHTGKYAAAARDVSAAIELYPNHAKYRDTLGTCYVRLSRYDEAIEAYTRAIAADPKFAQAYNNRGYAKTYGGGALRDAVADFDRAIELRPSYPIALANRGYARMQLGELREAIADFDKALELNPAAVETYVDRGEAHHRSGAFEKAVADFDKAVTIDVGIAAACDVFLKRARAHERLGNTEAARKDRAAAAAYMGIDPVPL